MARASAAAAGQKATDPAARLERFFARHLRHLKGRWAGRPFVLEPWQAREIIRPLFGTLQRNGLRRYSEGLIGIPRKNGKSSLAAGIALYGLFADGEPGAEVYSVAGSKPQARIVFGSARDMVLASPTLAAASRVYKDAIEVPETGSVYRVLSADAKLAHGYNPHFAVIDELHVHKNPDLYEALKTGTAARRQPLILSITTAGWDRSTICWKLYQHGRRGRDPNFFFYWREAPIGCRIDDTKAWRQANPGKWITVDYLRRQMKSGGVPEPVFRRLHLNQWTSSEELWIRAEEWDACGERPRFTDEGELWIAVDAAPMRDTTAVLIDELDGDGFHNVVAHVYEADRQMGILDYAKVEDLLREYVLQRNVRRILVDPFTMIRSMAMLREEGLPVEQFPQNDARMVPASSSLYDVVKEGRLRHGGDEVMREQALSAGAKQTSRGWRLHKLKSSGHIDSVVALAMAVHIAEQDAVDEAEPMVIVN